MTHYWWITVWRQQQRAIPASLAELQTRRPPARPGPHPPDVQMVFSNGGRAGQAAGRAGGFLPAGSSRGIPAPRSQTPPASHTPPERGNTVQRINPGLIHAVYFRLADKIFFSNTFILFKVKSFGKMIPFGSDC